MTKPIATPATQPEATETDGATAPEKKPKTRQPQFIAAGLATALVKLEGSVVAAKVRLDDATKARDAKLAELKSQSEDVQRMVAALRGGK
jgi:hypothetical protein